MTGLRGPTGRSSSSSGCRRILDVLRFHVPQVQPRHTIRASGRADVRGPTARIALHATKAFPCGICRTMNCRSDPSPAADSLRRIGFPAGIATVRRGAPVRGPAGRCSRRNQRLRSFSSSFSSSRSLRRVWHRKSVEVLRACRQGIPLQGCNGLLSGLGQTGCVRFVRA